MFKKKLLERCLFQVVPRRNLVINVDQLYDNKVYKLHLLEEGPSHTTELTKTDALKYYEQMDEIRKVENSIAQLYRQKKIRGFCHLYVGQEAVAVGINSVMRPQDTVITSYRCHGWAVLKCESISSVIAELIGNQSGVSRGKGGSMHIYGPQFYGGNGIVGSHVPLGVGIGLKHRYMDSDAISVTLYGDGAANQGQENSMMASGKKWRESDTIRFVELYEKAECLWNFRHPVYKNRNARDQAIQHIIKEMNLPDFGVNELKNKIKNIRSTYQQEVNKIRRSKQNFDGDIMEEYKTNLAWFPIADRFLKGVINSTKIPSVKTEDEDSSYFQQESPALYNLVETQMNGDTENDGLPQFTIDVHHIKEEPDEEPHQEVKKRRLSGHPYDDKFEEVVGHRSPITGEEGLKDEWYYFTHNVACQLRNLPLERALLCQKKIVDILTEERIDYIIKLKKEEKGCND